jgi:hypothetical protein
MQQHGGAIRLGQREHFICNRALQLYLLDQLGGRSRGAPVLERSLPFLASCFAPAAGVDEILCDACKPRPEWLIRVGLAFRGDDPGVLRDVVSKRSIPDQRTRELTHPPHLGKELLARWNPRVGHFHQLSAAANAIVRKNAANGRRRASAQRERMDRLMPPPKLSTAPADEAAK